MSAKESRKIKFAVVGCGFIGKRHASIISGHPEAELVALCDVQKPQDLPDSIQAPFFTSLEEMLVAGLEIDVVNICTPNGLHASQAIAALNRGKHVVCEKPMALSKQDCEEVIFQALRNSKHVFCVMQNRYSPPSLWMKEIVERNLLGDIFLVQVNCYWNRDDRYYKQGAWKGTNELDGGTLFTQFSHFVDMLYWLFGDVTDIHADLYDFAHARSTDFEDSGTVHFRFLKGGVGILNYSTAVWDKNLESSMTVIGRRGSIKIGGQYMNEVEYCHIDGYEMPTLPPSNPPNDYGAYKGSAANHHYVIENVVNTLKGKSVATTNALEGLKVVEIIERIYKTGRRHFKKEKAGVAAEARTP